MLKSPIFKDSKGLTFVEIMVCVIIMGIVVAVAIPNLRAFANEQTFENVAKGIKNDIRYARQLAISERDGKYLIFFTEEASSISDLYLIRRTADNVTVKRIELPKGVKLVRTNFSSNRLYFNPLGSPNQGGTITLGNDKGERLYIIIAVGTGRVRIDTKPPDSWFENP